MVTSHWMRYYHMQLYCMSCDYTSLAQDHTLVIICSLHPPSVQWQMLLNKASDTLSESHWLVGNVLCFILEVADRCRG